MKGKKKTMKPLIVYYSFSGVTRRLAECIAALTGGGLRAVVPHTPYAFHYNTAVKEARMQMQRGVCPTLSSGLEPLDGYDTVFIGSPNWLRSFAPPVLTFLRGADLSGKTVVPFCTHGGGGIGSIADNMKKECPQSVFLPAFAGTASFTEGEVSAWLTSIGCIQ